MSSHPDLGFGEYTAKRAGYWRHSFWWHALRVLMFLACAHTVVAASLLPIFGALTAMLYVIIPPIATMTAYDAIHDAPLFALLSLVLAIGLTGTLWPLAKTIAGVLPFFSRVFALLIVAIWMPTLAAEGLRWALMQNAIVSAKPQCHGAIMLMESLRERSDFGDFDHGISPHAWMLQNGTMQLWSYRRLRFEPAPQWRGGITDCETAVLATNPMNPSIEQRW